MNHQGATPTAARVIAGKRAKNERSKRIRYKIRYACVALWTTSGTHSTADGTSGAHSTCSPLTVFSGRVSAMPAFPCSLFSLSNLQPLQQVHADPRCVPSVVPGAQLNIQGPAQPGPQLAQTELLPGLPRQHHMLVAATAAPAAAPAATSLRAMHASPQRHASLPRPRTRRRSSDGAATGGGVRELPKAEAPPPKEQPLHDAPLRLLPEALPAPGTPWPGSAGGAGSAGSAGSVLAAPGAVRPGSAATASSAYSATADAAVASAAAADAAVASAAAACRRDGRCVSFAASFGGESGPTRHPTRHPARHATRCPTRSPAAAAPEGTSPEPRLDPAKA